MAGHNPYDRGHPDYAEIARLEAELDMPAEPFGPEDLYDKWRREPGAPEPEPEPHMSLLCQLQQDREHKPCRSGTCDGHGSGELCDLPCSCACHTAAAPPKPRPAPPPRVLRPPPVPAVGKVRCRACGNVWPRGLGTCNHCGGEEWWADENA